MEVTPLGEALGTEVRGVDVREISSAELIQLKKIFLKFHGVVFRDQKLSPTEEIEFSRSFGPLEVHISNRYLLKDRPEILVLSNQRENREYIGFENAGDYWHSDLSCMDKPSLGSLPYAIEIPREGGETEWSNQVLAHESLPTELKKITHGKRAIHSLNRSRNPRVYIPKHQQKDAERRYATIIPPDASYPIVRTHQETGRVALYVTERFTLGIEEMDPELSESLLQELFEVASQQSNIYRHKWRKGEVVIWDNRCLMNIACGGVPKGQIEHMHRTIVRGDKPY